MKSNYLTVKELPTTERPYEKAETMGADHLTDAELLAVIIRTGTKECRSIDLACQILKLSKVTSGLVGMNYITLTDLMQVKGIGKVKAIQILCICELSRRMSSEKREKHFDLSTPKSVAAYYMEQLRHLRQEKILLVMLDSKSKLIKDCVISSGTVNSSIFSPRELFLKALEYAAVGIILLHNHPSGDPTPSNDDLQATKRIKEAGLIIGIKLWDHIIIGDKDYVSFREEGLLQD